MCSPHSSKKCTHTTLWQAARPSLLTGETSVLPAGSSKAWCVARPGVQLACSQRRPDPDCVSLVRAAKKKTAQTTSQQAQSSPPTWQLLRLLAPPVRQRIVACAPPHPERVRLETTCPKGSSQHQHRLVAPVWELCNGQNPSTIQPFTFLHFYNPISSLRAPRFSSSSA
jgi:hypothetical protein